MEKKILQAGGLVTSLGHLPPSLFTHTLNLRARRSYISFGRMLRAFLLDWSRTVALCLSVSGKWPA
ncbi:hypothetical protein KP509_35G054300 [Ceratopteris richardii]|uniref:Uncharacterized protein n=1 Tax=Ceratopteris richardii TaxID=49495 RepID=A0A8T2QFL7_CERRI|nr:hypothetical protein KP509_35G054300 [Ceratopteris richardii]